MTDSGTMDDRDGMISHDSCLYLRVLIDRTSHLFLTAEAKRVISIFNLLLNKLISYSFF